MTTKHLLIAAGLAGALYWLARRASSSTTPATPSTTPKMPGTGGYDGGGILPPWMMDHAPVPLSDVAAPGGGFAVRTSDNGAAIADAMGTRTNRLVAQPSAVASMTARQRKAIGIYDADPYAGLLYKPPGTGGSYS